MMPINDLRAFLLGVWQVRREINDARAGQDGTFRGRAVFHEDGADLIYEEIGTLSLGGHEGEASRRYRYQFSDDPGVAHVLFDDGNPFHVLDLTSGAWSGVHLCDPDTYEGTVIGVSEDQWQSQWQVIGPRKDYIMKTTYTLR